MQDNLTLAQKEVENQKERIISLKTTEKMLIQWIQQLENNIMYVKADLIDAEIALEQAEKWEAIEKKEKFVE